MADKPGDASQNWREKYLDALGAQEVLERKFAQQEQLLRRALARIIISADGQDDVLDTALSTLQTRLRSDDDLQPSVVQIDEAVREFESRRTQMVLDITEALTATLTPLQQLSLPQTLNKEIRHYLKQLPQRVQKVQLYPALFQQLASIQQQALAQLQTPPAPSKWKQWLGKPPPVATAVSSAELEETSDVAAGNDSPVIFDQAIVPAPTHGGVALVATPLVDQISLLLAHLLDDIDVPESITPKVNELQARIAAGLHSENVITTLRAVRDLVMEAYLIANKAFATYLNNVNQELTDIYAVLGGAAKHQSSRVEHTRQLQDTVMQQMTDLETGTASATDLNQLKNMVQSQLGNIREALNDFQQSEQDQQQLTGQLQELADKIKIMEEDAEKNRTTLEKHRYKSLHDPLTELPNREAYSERILYEFRRWQRYQHPLSLAMCDLDYFKKINDNYGHQAGDRVLKVISRSIAKRLRQVDFFGRYGGEEFVVILPETSLESSYVFLEKIRAAIAGTSFNYKDEPLVITLSLGVTEFKTGDTIESALARSDAALYAAKAKGRNRCEIDR